MSLDSSAISLITRYPDTLTQLQQAGVTAEFFVEDWQKVFTYCVRSKRDHGKVPSPDVLSNRYNWLELGPVRRRDMPMLLSDLRKRRTHSEFVNALLEAVDNADDYDAIGDVMQELQGKINSLSSRNGTNHIRDLFDPETTRELMREIRKRRSGQTMGFPTGLNKLDAHIGGMQRKRFIVVMGRPGLGKSWLDLLFVANTVVNGGKVLLYPLEMTLFETAMRLYTIFTQHIFGGTKVLKNYDLTQGHISTRKILRFIHALEDKYAGQLMVADVGSIGDPYTVERIEAETELHRPDLDWIDYITLMRAPRDYRDNESTAIKALAEGCKGIAQRQDCVVGASAQVNRDAIKGNHQLPRLEHIMYGDAIGQAADQVIPINRNGHYLYYALVKNRHGPEFGRTRVKFFPNEGVFTEDADGDEDDD